MSNPRAIRIAVTALGGQGGGVLAGWIVALGEASGYIAQSTSVPGVAQRTGATVYYVELFPKADAQTKGKMPVLALTPVPGDIDIVIAAELMEAGRAITRGFVTPKTTLIASSHRDYAIDEKIGMGDGRQPADTVLTIARKAAARVIIADMASEAAAAGTVISAVMFGALAGSGALRVDPALFEQIIRASGRAVESNLRGFARGLQIAREETAEALNEETSSTQINLPATAGAPLLKRLHEEFPSSAHYYGREGLRRVVDYQDAAYGGTYLDYLARVLEADRAAGGDLRDFSLTQVAAKHLALWMTYDDAIRVADLKTRASRFERFRNDVRAESGQIVDVYEFLHPRVEEVCDILPAGVARTILANSSMRVVLTKLLGGGRRIATTKLRGFLPLYFISSLRFLRRYSYRYAVEDRRIRNWLSLVLECVKTDYELALEISKLQRLIKGYGDTHERGLGNFNRIVSSIDAIRRTDAPANTVARLRDEALKDENGVALEAALQRLVQKPAAAA